MAGTLDVSVRPRRAADATAVRRVARRAWRATYEDIAPSGFISAVLRKGYDRRRLLASLVDARRDAFVAEVQGVVVGYADVRTDGASACELTRIYVLPEHQGRGAGFALLSAALEAARERGVSGMTVGVDPENRAALAWYGRQGFVATGRDAFEISGWSRPLLLLARPVGGDARVSRR